LSHYWLRLSVTCGAINIYTDTEIIPQSVENRHASLQLLGSPREINFTLRIRIDLLASVLTVRDSMLVIIAVVSENRLII
jgi:hypothetical protein